MTKHLLLRYRIQNKQFVKILGSISAKGSTVVLNTEVFTDRDQQCRSHLHGSVLGLYVKGLLPHVRLEVSMNYTHNFLTHLAVCISLSRTSVFKSEDFRIFLKLCCISFSLTVVHYGIKYLLLCSVPSLF